MMDILVLNWRDPKHPLAGGAEQMVLEHAKFWRKNGASITWFASSFKNCKKVEIIDGIKIIRKGNHYTVFLWSHLYNFLGKLGKPTLIIDCFHFIPYFSKFYFRKTPIIGLIQEVAGDLWFENLPYPLAFVGWLIEGRILRLYRKSNFITGSESARKDLLKNGFKDKNIKVINHGIYKSTKRNFKKEKFPTIIFVGRISKDKGIEDALTTIKLLSRDYREIKFWIVGKSETLEYEKKIKRMIKQYNLAKNCQWFGFVSESKKFELMGRSWVLVHPSRREGWGLNVIEANYVGTPAVGYDVPGLKDSIKNNKTGVLVNPDAMSLADGVEELINDKEKYEKIKMNAKKWSENFDWEKSGEESYRYINQILKQNEKKH